MHVIFTVVAVCDKKPGHFLFAKVHDTLRNLRDQDKTAEEMMTSLQADKLSECDQRHIRFWAELYAASSKEDLLNPLPPLNTDEVGEQITDDPANKGCFEHKCIRSQTSF